jgi:hypothetical protein
VTAHADGGGPEGSRARRAVADRLAGQAATGPARSGGYELIGKETVASDVKHCAVSPEPHVPDE